MKLLRHTYYVFFIFLFAGCNNTPEYQVAIESCSNMPVTRASATCFVYGAQAYIFGGRDSVGKYQSSIYCYDALTDTWSLPIPTPLSPRVNATSCVVGHEAFIGLGFNGYYNDTVGYLKDWWKMDLETGEWTRLSPYPNKRTDRAICFTTETDIYVGYGFENRYTRDIFCYHIATNRWDSVDVHAGAFDFPDRSFGGTGAQVQGRFFYGTGYKTFSLDWWGEFLPEGGWVTKHRVPHGGRTTAAAAADNCAIYVIGGFHVGGVGTNAEVLKDIECYDPILDCWQHIGNLPAGRFNHVAFYIAPYIYVGMGDDENFTPTNTLWRYKK